MNPAPVANRMLTLRALRVFRLWILNSKIKQQEHISQGNKSTYKQNRWILFCLLIVLFVRQPVESKCGALPGFTNLTDLARI